MADIGTDAEALKKDAENAAHTEVDAIHESLDSFVKQSENGAHGVIQRVEAWLKKELALLESKL